MSRTTNGNQTILAEHGEVDLLCQELVRQFYEKANRPRAETIAARLQVELSMWPEFAESIRGEEISSVIAELHGDYATAIASREAEIRKILELHTLAMNTPSWAYVSRQYDFSDVSDRLDLLATLYDRRGDTQRALAILRESKSYCANHNIPFDGQDLLDEIGKAGAGKRSIGEAQPKRARKRKPVKQA